MRHLRALSVARQYPRAGHLEHGLEWHMSKQSLLLSEPGPVLVGSSYEVPGGGVSRQVRKYSSFQSHEDYWDLVRRYDDDGLQHNLHEVFPADQARCLYFDLDGPPGYKETQSKIVEWLQHYVRWFFAGDRMEWEASSPHPVVLTSPDPSKFSCHVVFPELQFANHEEQARYMEVLFDGLPALEVKLEGGQSVPILKQVVDRVPYSRFQLFRGPYACKLSQGRLRRDTQLDPEGHFRGDPLTIFAGHVVEEYALDIPLVEDLLARNDELRHLHEQAKAMVASAGVELGRISPQDRANLYDAKFRRHDSGVINFTGQTDLEVYESALGLLHPDRASQWWSWWRVSGVTCRMLRRYQDNEHARSRIWNAHFQWSSAYPTFDAEENVELVEGLAGKPLPDETLLFRMACFDNPNADVRLAPWQTHLRPVSPELHRVAGAC